VKEKGWEKTIDIQVRGRCEGRGSKIREDGSGNSPVETIKGKGENHGWTWAEESGSVRKCGERTISQRMQAWMGRKGGHGIGVLDKDVPGRTKGKRRLERGQGRGRRGESSKGKEIPCLRKAHQGDPVPVNPADELRWGRGGDGNGHRGVAGHFVSRKNERKAETAPQQSASRRASTA